MLIAQKHIALIAQRLHLEKKALDDSQKGVFTA